MGTIKNDQHYISNNILKTPKKMLFNSHLFNPNNPEDIGHCHTTDH